MTRTDKLTHDPDFLKLWIGESVSLVGTQVTHLALPLTAAALLGASPLQMGLLGAAQSVPYLLLGLVAGVWVDRLKRRPIMIVANLGRAALLLTIPLAAVADILRLEQLLAVAFAVGVLNVFFGVAYSSYLPSIVCREDLPRGNARLALSAEIARVSGPGLAGTLVQLLSAPIALVVDAASFLMSALCLSRIKVHETSCAASPERRSIVSEMREGARVAASDPILRTLVGAAGLGNVGDGLLFGSGVSILFATRDLGLEAMVLGGVMAGVGVGGLLGAALAGPATSRWGIGATFLAAMVLWGASYLALAAVAGPPDRAAILMALALGLVGIVNPVAGVNAVTLRQAVTPERLRGRVTAVAQVTTWGGVTIGALVGGVAAEHFGLRGTVALAGLLPLAGFVWLLFSPIRSLREVPTAVAA